MDSKTNLDDVSRSPRCSSAFRPVFGPIIEFPRSSLWRIETAAGDATWGFNRHDRDLGFGTLRDCERAIQSFLEAGIETDEQMEDLTDEEMAKIACGNLAW